MTWVVLLGSDSITDETGIDLVDTLGSAQNFDPDLSTLDVTYAIVGQDRTDEGVSVALDSSRYTAALNNDRELALHLPNLHTEGLVAPGTEYQYRISYTTELLDARDVPAGTVFRNSATYDGKTMSSRVEYANVAGGSADGTIPVGAFSVAKTVEGVPADVASGLSFTLLASYEKDGQQVTEEIVLSGDGTPSGLSGIPQGTVVSLSEPQVAVEGYDFQELEFTAVTENDAIVIGEGGDSATVAITNGTLSLGLNNTYAPPVEETTTPPVEETTTPATTPATTAPGTTPATTPVTTAPGTSPATSGNPSSTTQQAAPVSSGTPSSPAPQGSSVLRLPRTGADVAIWGAIGAGMILGGLILVGYARRFRDSRR
ncbi:DUF5979 domain-containing protein [Brachybacterium nesterenkovii]|uniref:DUF5979 domain-containing protein n=1 Tax=Brachybacterium nesterenkovii TaxID=47847 RepID=UPI00321AA598